MLTTSPWAILAPGEVVGLGMAIGTKQPQVLETVVIAIPVHVMKRHVEPSTSPLAEAAALAFFSFQPRPHQPDLEVVPTSVDALDQQFGQRESVRSRDDRAPRDRRIPALT